MPLSGALTLTFNGETTPSGRLDAAGLSALATSSSPADAAKQVRDALESLSVISTVGVTLHENVSSSDLINMTFDVQFHYGPLVSNPLNLGPLPLVILGVDSLHGLREHETSVVQRGEAPTNFSFPEQRIELNASDSLLDSLEGGLSFHFNVSVLEIPTHERSQSLIPAHHKGLQRVAPSNLFLTGCPDDHHCPRARDGDGDA